MHWLSSANACLFLGCAAIYALLNKICRKSTDQNCPNLFDYQDFCAVGADVSACWSVRPLGLKLNYIGSEIVEREE